MKVRRIKPVTNCLLSTLSLSQSRDSRLSDDRIPHGRHTNFPPTEITQNLARSQSPQDAHKIGKSAASKISNSVSLQYKFTDEEIAQYLTDRLRTKETNTGRLIESREDNGIATEKTNRRLSGGRDRCGEEAEEDGGRGRREGGAKRRASSC